MKGKYYDSRNPHKYKGKGWSGLPRESFVKNVGDGYHDLPRNYRDDREYADEMSMQNNQTVKRHYRNAKSAK